MKNYAEHARVTAICVNLALDAVEADIRSALERAQPEVAQVLEKLLVGLKRQRVEETKSLNAPFVM